MLHESDRILLGKHGVIMSPVIPHEVIYILYIEAYIYIYNTGQHTNFCHRYYIDFRVYQVRRFRK